ncbi:signal peptidase I [Geodermatophilus sp. SYSU D00815]
MTAVLPVRRPGAALALPPEAGTLAARRAGVARTILSGLVRWSVRGLVAAAVLAFAVLAVGPHVLGYRTMTMLTGSMAPAIEAGDVVVSTPLDVEDVTEGMVISYHIPIDDHRVVTHRVVSVEHGDDGSVTVQTKGDANAGVDPWQATLQGDTAYQVRAVIPELGTVIQFLREPAVSKALVWGAPALLAGWLILSIWRPARDEEDEA